MDSFGRFDIFYAVCIFFRKDHPPFCFLKRIVRPVNWKKKQDNFNKDNLAHKYIHRLNRASLYSPLLHRLSLFKSFQIRAVCFYIGLSFCIGTYLQICLFILILYCSQKMKEMHSFRSFFERIKETINCFRDCLTFSKKVKKKM